MTDQAHKRLEKVLPPELRLNSEMKEQILERAYQRMETQKHKKGPKLKPLVTMTAAAALSGALVIPYAYQYQHQQAFENALSQETIQKAVIAGTLYPDLINGVYVEANNEIVHSNGEGIYSYSIDRKSDELLVPLPEDAPFSSVTLKATEKWLAWETDTLQLVNRVTGDRQDLGETLGVLSIHGDQLFYIGSSSETGNEKMAYFLRDLETGRITKIQDLNGVSHSAPLVEENNLVIAEQRETDRGLSVVLSVYDLELLQQSREVVLPFTEITNPQLTQSKVFGFFTNESGKSSLGYVDLETERYSEISVENEGIYAVYNDYLAVSEKTGKTDTVRLYKMTDNHAYPIDLLKGIEERLVKPRFTETGTLVVNGEGPEKPIYIIDTAKLK